MMHAHLRLGAALVIAVGVFAAACNKDNDSGPARTPNELKLEAHAWNLSQATLTDSAVTDSSILSDCMADDSLVFTTSRQYHYVDGSVVCDSTVLPYGTGTWAFNTAEDTLVLNATTGAWNFKVNALTDSTLQLTLTDSVAEKAVIREFHFVTK
jgi:hypothetical protein